jgi:hypothetical protein
MLRGLKMYGMAGAVSDLIEQGAPAFEAAVPILSQLLKAEMTERLANTTGYFCTRQSLLRSRYNNSNGHRFSHLIYQYNTNIRWAV